MSFVSFTATIVVVAATTTATSDCWQGISSVGFTIATATAEATAEAIDPAGRLIGEYSAFQMR